VIFLLSPSNFLFLFPLVDDFSRRKWLAVTWLQFTAYFNFVTDALLLSAFSGATVNSSFLEFFLRQSGYGHLDKFLFSVSRLLFLLLSSLFLVPSCFFSSTAIFGCIFGFLEPLNGIFQLPTESHSEADSNFMLELSFGGYAKFRISLHLQVLASQALISVVVQVY
jgi:hypothetical protein